MMSFIPQASYEPMLVISMQDISRTFWELKRKENPQFSMAQLYKRKLLQDNSTLSKLESSEQHFERRVELKRNTAVTNNITSSGQSDKVQPVLAAPVNFQTPKPRPFVKPTTPQVKQPKQPSVDILKRKENTNSPCCLCNSTSHGTHRCREYLRKL